MTTTTDCSTVILVLLFIGEISCDGECGIQNLQDKIIAGDATAIDEYPWTALIRYKNPSSNKETWGCGGSLVGKKTILTAAHCVEKEAIAVFGDIAFVRLGEYDHTTDVDCVVFSQLFKDCADDPMDIKVSSTVIHPERNSKSKLHDIAILILETVPPYTDFIRPICLPETLSLEDINNKKGMLYVTGWGWTIGTIPSQSNVKRHVEVNTVSTTVCRSFYKTNYNEKYQLCAGGEKGKIACRGDSGGPLMYSKGNKWILTGIVSFGPFICGRPGFDGDPAVFTRVAGYLPWIKSVLMSVTDHDKV